MGGVGDGARGQVMKALTLTQPWASLMAIGAKHIETRSWAPRGLRVGELVAIHAGKGLGEMDARLFCELCISEPFRSCLVAGRDAGLIHQQGKVFVPADLPRGAILAVARFARCIPGDGPEARALSKQERAFGFYGPGRFGWVFDRMYPLREPILARGALGLWNWPAPDDWAKRIAKAESGVPA